MNDSGSHLTSSRISRVFRPLRAKCIALSAPIATSQTKQTKHHAPITYGNSARQNYARNAGISARAFSLVPIPTPERLPFHYQDLSRETLRDLSALSRKIGEVRDSFRSLVKVANGGWPNSATAFRKLSVPRLGIMCASMVGEQLEDHIEESLEDVNVGDCDKEIEMFEEIYEAVPPHYRRYTMVSHALKYILDKCPQYPTLLTVLLDVTVAFRLVAETEQLLRLLCLVAFRPTNESSTASPIDERAGADHFFSLYEKCCGSQLSGSPLISNAAFVRILVSVSPDIPYNIFSCNPIPKIIRGVRLRDYHDFVDLCLVQARGIADGSATGNSRQLMLSEWLRVMMQHLRNNESSAIPRLEDFVASVEVLADMHAMGLPKSSIAAALNHSVLTLVLYCFSSSHFSRCSLASRQALFAILKEVAPATETYDQFAVMLLPRDTIMYALEFIALPDVLSWADVLRNHGLYHHEASFCSAALRQVENLLANQPASRSSVTNRLLRSLEALRPDLVDRIEDAERLCFGPANEDQDTTEWRWEEMVGCWVQKSPAVVRKVSKQFKRQRGNSSKVHRNKRAIRYTESSTSSTSSSHSTPQSSASPEPDLPTQDLFTPPSSPSPSVGSRSARSLSPPPRRISNFGSILADAQSNCTVLHTPNSRGARKYTISERPPQHAPATDDFPDDEAQLSSDDLNLSYSSPTVVRHGRMY